MSKKHFDAIADTLAHRIILVLNAYKEYTEGAMEKEKATILEEYRELIIDLCGNFKDFNGDFKRMRFVNYINDKLEGAGHPRKM